MKTTPWFSVNQPPARAGWYEVKCAHGLFGTKPGHKRQRLFWDAYGWRWDDRDQDLANFGQCCDKWRGLVKEGTNG